MTSLGALLTARAADDPHRRAYTFLADGRDEARVLTYGELHRLAAQCAWRLRQHVAPGERVLLLNENSLDFLVGFMASMIAGTVAVPVPPVDGARLRRTLPRLQAVVADSSATAVLASIEIRDQVKEAFAKERDLEHVSWTVTAGTVDEPLLETRPVNGSDVALLQYTSGSTSIPKGVVVTHATLLDNLVRLQQCFEYTSASTTVTWMPYFHDYGLIDGLLEPLFAKASCYIISPVAFIKRPWRWLEAVSTYRATHIHGPNFAFGLCVDRALEHVPPTLDLRSLVVAGCAAEPIRRDTAERFIAAFAPFGFRREAFAPAYGLAEATLVVSAKRNGTVHRTAFLAPEALEAGRCEDVAPEHARARAIVSCGPAAGDDTVLRIVDPETGRELPDDTIGELWIANASVAAGYWNQPEETAAVFGAHTTAGTGPMLRTGDLAFLRDGELYITGRRKDLVIVNGSNHYPHDIEQTVEAADAALRPTCVAAFSVERDGTERLVVAAELARRVADPDATIAAIRNAVSHEHEIACGAVVLLPKGSIFKTSSGKLQRHACRDAFLAGTFEPLASWTEAVSSIATASAAATSDGQSWESWLCRLLAGRKRIAEARIDPAQPFSSFGLSSLEAVEIAALIEERTGRNVPVTALWEYPSVRAFAAFLACDEAEPRAPGGTAASEPIAIVGLACEFPGDSATPAAFWRTLLAGEACTGDAPPGRFRPGTAAPPGGYVRDLFRFDAAFFGISDTEARSLDPQQRRMLETTWHALEDAGIVPGALSGSDTGVFVGISATDYAQQVYDARGGADRFAATGTSGAVIANRVSYFFDLRGPSLAIDTACSASLVAVHQACRALAAGDCGVAIVGGVNALLSADVSNVLDEAQMLSPSARCRPFDARADGYVRGEGCGVVVLKRLADARRDGNRVLAVIRGSSVVQDGRSNGLSAPNGLAQRHAIRRALAEARVDPANVAYVEAHGTGTPLGDPIELHALADSYGSTGASPCYVGAVKGAIGHLEGAAGIAGLIKVVLALGRETIPPNAYLGATTPHAEISATRLRLPNTAVAWPAGAEPRFAAVSSFGFGGTLAHVIVSDDPASRSAPAIAAAPPLLVLSAADRPALRATAACYAELCRSAGPDLSAVCASTAATRTVFADQAAFAFASADDLIEQLEAFAGDRGAEPAAPAPGWEQRFAALVPAAAASLPLYPFGGAEHRIETTGRSPILDALADGRPDAAVAALALQRPDLTGQALTAEAWAEAVATAHRAAAQTLSGAVPQRFVTHWVAVELPPPTRADAARACLLLGEDGTELRELAAAIERDRGLRRVDDVAALGDGIVLFLGGGRAGESAGDAALRLGAELPALLRATAAAPRARVWVVTLGAAPARPADPIALEGAALWGAGRCVALELPDRWGGLIDLPPSFGPSDADRCIAAVAAGPREDQLALRDGAWLAPRLAAAPRAHAAPPVFRPDAVYWIAGGTGALGRHALRAFIDGGAKHIVLSGRSATAPELELADADVRYVPADLTRRADGLRVLTEIDETGLPLAGVVHAAGIAAESPTEALTPEAFREIAAAKIAGAWTLHELTAGRPLELFVCFSSIAGVWGAAGQAHYAAGNHFLDLLCEERRRRGLPGTAIAWGPWAGGGLVTAERAARFTRIGLDPLDPAAARAALAAVLAGDQARVAVAAVRWEPFGATFTARRPSPFLERFVRAAAPAATAAMHPAPAGESPTQLRARLREHVGRVVAEQLGAGRVADPERGFFDQGLDSLAVVAIGNRLAADLGLPLQSGALFSYPTVVALADHLVALARPAALAAPVAALLAADEAAAAASLSAAELARQIAREFEALVQVAE